MKTMLGLRSAAWARAGRRRRAARKMRWVMSLSVVRCQLSVLTRGRENEKGQPFGLAVRLCSCSHVGSDVAVLVDKGVDGVGEVAEGGFAVVDVELGGASAAGAQGV